MNRLKKKAWGQVGPLFHATSSQAFTEMVEAGQITPGGYIGVTSNGLNTNPDEDLQPSGDENGVYLGTMDVMNYYYENAVEGTHLITKYPNFAVLLEVEVDEDALGPDYDDLSINMSQENPTIQQIQEEMFINNDPYWKQSLDSIDQVVHKGPISIDRVKSVEFIFKAIKNGDYLSDESKDDMIEIFRENDIYHSSKYSVNEAYSTIQQFYRVLDSVHSEQTQVANRLKKVQIKKG